MTTAEAQSVDHPGRLGLGLSLGWVAVFALAAWLRTPAAAWLGLAALGTVGLVTLAATRHRPWTLVTTALLGGAIGLAGGVSVRLNRLDTAWPEVRTRVEDRAGVALRRELDVLRARADTAVSRVARSATFSQLEQIRRGTGVSALALYGPDGTPIVWAGEHRGGVPDSVRRGARAYAFGAGPLFSYAYFARPAGQGRTAVGAVLLEGNLATGEGPRPFAEHFADRQGIRPVFTLPERARGGAVWDWLADRPIFSVTFATLTEARWRARVQTRGRLAVGALWLLALLCLVFACRRGRWPGGGLTLVAAAALLVPPWTTPVGALLVALFGVGAWLLGTRARATPVWPPGLAAIPAALLIPGVLWMVRHSSPPSLAHDAAGGIGLQLAVVLLIALPLWAVLHGGGSGTRLRKGIGWAAMVLAAALAAALLVWAPMDRPPPLWSAALWAIPFGMLAWAVPARRNSRSALLAWMGVAWIAALAALPHLWLLHWHAQLARADAELARLGSQPDPRLDNLLRNFAERALLFAADGERGVNLLYRSWVASGLAREGYEMRVSLWNGTRPEAELQLSDQQLPRELVSRVLAAARAAEEPIVQRFARVEAVHYLLAVSLPGGAVITVAVPPQRRLDRATALERFLDPSGADQAEPATLSLVPVPPGTFFSPARWVRTPTGWRSEVRVPFPGGPMHAHMLVATPSPVMLGTRTMLLAALHLGILVLVWGIASAVNGDAGAPGIREWVRTFRGRLTFALFGFFLLPTVIFSATAYQALAREVVRTAEALASRSLEQAVDEGSHQPIDALARHVRADLLLYQGGVLVQASSPEVLDLGLYPTWMPRETFLAFRSGDVLNVVEQRRLSEVPYLFAYHRSGPNAVLAAPRALVSSDIARRQQDLAAVVVLAALIGAGLSFGLSLLVGRALSAPIERLSRAAASVGRGNLGVRLPEEHPNEFGGLFRSFNRMVRRLRRARAAEVRTARVLAWGEMARQVAHEIKNPLTPIKLSVQHLRRAYRDERPNFGEILDRNVDGVLREIDRLGEIARAFARFGTPGEANGALEQVELEPVLADSLALYRSGDDGIAYSLEVAPGTPAVKARVGELREVLVNLLENARDALDGIGQVAVRAAPVDSEWVTLEVADTGSGIPADTLPRIFEPQFSTRTSGTGLGLAIVRRMVEGWGAEIDAESEPGIGTTMRVRLRVAPESAPN